MMLKKERFSINVDDASDYFYQWRWPPARVVENAFGSSFLAEELIDWGATRDLEELEALRSRRVISALLVPAMGDQKAPDMAQLVHQHVLRQGGCLCDHEWMSYGYAPPPVVNRVKRHIFFDCKNLLIR